MLTTKISIGLPYITPLPWRAFLVRGDKAAPMDRIIVPSSFKGGFADMAKKLTESMALLRHFGKPSYFLTVTCNTVSVSALSLHYVFFILLSSCLVWM